MTTKDLIAEHNALAERLGLPALTGWKSGKEKLQERIDGLTTAVSDRTEAIALADLDAQVDPLDLGAPEALGEPEPDQVPPGAAEETTDEHDEPAEAPDAEPRGSIGQMVADLLVDAEGYDYQEIVDIVRGQFPSAKTSKRSIASVAAGLRRKGIEVPMRRKPKA
jgi:hypothetical protein